MISGSTRRVIFLFGGLRPVTMAFRHISAVISGESSSMRMSSSRIALTRFQSVFVVPRRSNSLSSLVVYLTILERGIVSPPFLSFGASERNTPDGISSPRVHQDEHHALDLCNIHPADLVGFHLGRGECDLLRCFEYLPRRNRWIGIRTLMVAKGIRDRLILVVLDTCFAASCSRGQDRHRKMDHVLQRAASAFESGRPTARQGILSKQRCRFSGSRRPAGGGVTPRTVHLIFAVNLIKPRGPPL